jgi:glycogen operon protein
MLSHGDELGRTQLGNNNAYCHDSPLTWINWRLTPAQEQLLQFTRAILSIRSAVPLLQRRSFFKPGRASRELMWVGADGREMTHEAWHQPGNHLLGMLMQAGGDALLLLLNAAARSKPFLLPVEVLSGVWTEVVNTFHPGPPVIREGQLTLPPRSLLLLRQTRQD